MCQVITTVVEPIQFRLHYEKVADEPEDGQLIKVPVTEDLEIDTSIKSDACVAYYADGTSLDAEEQKNVTPVFSRELGLAIEPLKPGHTLDSLWKVL